MFLRPSWDEMFMFQAISCAARHSCLKRGVGAVLVKNNKIIGTGYNGAARGITTCRELGYCYYEKLAHDETKKSKLDSQIVRENFKIFCQAVHAESNAMSQCSWREAEEAILYVTNYPCPRCAQDIIITNRLSAVKIWKEYLKNSHLTIDEERASERKLLEAGIATNFVALTKERILEIAVYMADAIGVRNEYKFRD